MPPSDRPAPSERRRLDAPTVYSLLLVVLLGGLAAALYAGYEVLNPAAAGVCSVSKWISCVNVLDSGHTTFLGVPYLPDYAIGIAGYSLMFALAVMAYRTFDRRYLEALAVVSGLALLFVAYLVYTETVVIGAICPVCTTAHILDVVTFGLTLYLLRMSRPEDDEDAAPAASAAPSGTPGPAE